MVPAKKDTNRTKTIKMIIFGEKKVPVSKVLQHPQNDLKNFI
jgi:hypothetical protein